MTNANSESSTVQSRGMPGWLRPNVGTALVLATVLSVLTFLLTSDGEPITQATPAAASEIQLVAAENDGAGPELGVTDEPVVAESAGTTPEAAAESTDAALTDAGSAPLVSAAAESRAAAGFGTDSTMAAVAASSLITNMGPTEVGFVTNFPAVNYTWERVELSSPGMTEMGWLGQLNGRIVAISPSWGIGADDGQTQTLVTHASSDGFNWEISGSYVLPEETWISRVIGNGQSLVALGERWAMDQQQNEYFLFSSEDGESWTMTDLSLDVGPEEHVYIQNAAMGPAGIALAVQYETYPDEAPQVLLFDPYEVTLDYASNSYTLTDTRSGDIVVADSMEALFNWGNDGQNVYDPSTGELLTTVPYEIWEQAWNDFYEPGWGGSPLPIPIDYGEPTERPQIAIEYDGFLIEVDEYGGTYVVSDAETGDEIGAGTLDRLYQGPPPTFIDPETGEVVLTVSWDDWYQAEEQSYADRAYEEAAEYNYRSRTALVTSPDGEAWDSETVADGTGSSTSYLAATNDGFVAMVSAYEEYGGDRGSVWTMSGGTWSATPATRNDLWMHQVVDTDDGLVGVGDGAGGQAVWSSPDGVTWVSEFATVPQDDGSSAWLAAVASGETGIVGALAIRERWSDFNPLVIEQEQYTATFEDGETVLRVTETGSGDTVVAFTWQDFEGGSASGAVSWDGESTSIDLGNGDVMVITDEEAFTATESRYADTGQMGLSVFLNDGAEWTEAVVDVEGAISGASQLLLIDGRIIIGGSYWGPRYDTPGENTFVAIVGTPLGG